MTVALDESTKMRVSELKGPRLSFWVAKAEGMDVVMEQYMVNPPRDAAVWLVKGRAEKVDIDFGAGPYSPHVDWAVAGPLLDKYNIVLVPVNYDTNKQWTAKVNDPYDDYIDDSLPYIVHKRNANNDFIYSEITGATPQETICRAVVAAKFGPEVDA